MKIWSTLLGAFGLVTGLQGLITNSANADALLVGAPDVGTGYYGMYCNTCVAAEFTLNGSYHVSTIDVELRTPATTSFTTFDFSLQNSLTAPITTFFSGSITVPLGNMSTGILNISQNLSAGTYFIVGNVPGYDGTPVTPGDVDGWWLSNGQYTDVAGVVTDGVWDPITSPPVLTSGLNNGILYYAPDFSVFGSPVPEPTSFILLGGGLLGLGVVLRTRRV